MRAFICPKCKEIMCKAKGTWDIWYCLPCNYQWDVYAPEGEEPQKTEVDTIDLYDVWTGQVWKRGYPTNDHT